jgi:DNA repair protein RadC
MGRYSKIQQIPEIDRPREKLVRKGTAALSDFELLEVLLGNGNGKSDVGTIARQVQRLMQKGTQYVSLESLLQIKGISTATATKVLSSLELAKRHLLLDIKPLKSQQDILTRLHDLRTKSQENFVCLSLDGGSRLLAQRTVTVGTLDSVLAHPREVFSDPIVDRAAYIIVAHNHPSGDPQPSDKDIMLTQQLAAAGQLIGIPLHDHIIVTKTEQFSYRQNHLL